MRLMVVEQAWQPQPQRGQATPVSFGDLVGSPDEHTAARGSLVVPPRALLVVTRRDGEVHV